MGKFNSPHEFVFFFAGVDKRNMAGHRINSILLNVPHHTQTEGIVTQSRELVKSASAKYVMLDSGGFELLGAEKKRLAISHNPQAPILQSGKFNIAPEHVIEAAQKLKPDIVVALDYPIKTLKEEQEREMEFRLKLKFNVKWAMRTAELREKYCPQIKLFIPVQCYDLRQVDIFFKRIKGINYDGVSMPVRNLGQRGILSFLIRFHEMGIRRVHLLGTASFYTIVLCAYLAKHYFNWISLDARSWGILAEKLKYLNPNLTTTRIADHGVGRIGKAECKCRMCRKKTYSEMKGLSYQERGAFLRNFLWVHNRWATEKGLKDSFKNSRSLSSLTRFLKKCSSTKWKIREVCESLGAMNCEKSQHQDSLVRGKEVGMAGPNPGGFQ